jgi:GR25 family glycosyltransferase involved in LPS biosynthesis
MQQPDFTYCVDDSLNITYDRTKQIAETLIISILNNENSINCATRAINSCRKVGQPNPKLFWGYDGTDKTTIKTPEHLKNSDAMRLIKVMDTRLSITEVACFLSHIAAWVHCIKINKPVVILEHDSIMLRPFTEMMVTNTLEYLGHIGELAARLKITNPEILEFVIAGGQYELSTKKYMDIPLVQMINTNYLLILGLHNYAIDPIMAKKLFSYVLKHGLVNPADAVIEQHEFTMLQTGIYAVQSPNAEYTSTIDADLTGNRKFTYAIPGVDV